MSVLMILVFISLAVVLVLTIAAVASSPPTSFQVLGRVQRSPVRSGPFMRRSTDRLPTEPEPASVVAAGFQ
jgi:hypothetical protein